MTCSHSDEADAEIPSISSRSREVVDLRSSLPTRVRRACERCRQHKSRCDPFRPCSLCVRANVPCRPLSTSQPGQVSARTRMKSKQVSRGRRKQTGFPLENSDEQSQDAARSSGRNAPTPARTQSPEIPSTRDQFEESSRTDGMTPSLACGEAESAIGIARRLCELGSHHIDEQTTFAIPGCQTTGPSGNLFNSAPTGQRVSITVILGQTFPPMGLVYNLVEEYFHSVHWFSLAIFEPKFRSKLHSIKDGCAYPSQRPFLLLLAVMLGMAAWYRSRRSDTDLTDDGEDWERWSADMMKLVESNVVELMDQPSVTATQTCILLGSHHVYHGRPNLSFSLLGATIKMAQSIGLQRQCLRGNPEDIEERKRVWWTIYTWDRFASITYGRPLGINDKDCNLQMPSDVLENPSFASSGFPQDEAICYSTYQRELNRLYWIASPALEAIFGSRTFGTSEQLAGDSYFALVKHATKKLEQWRFCLPSHLSLDLEKDVLPDGPASSRAYALQSLSLQLTYDNILIVLHRPLLARQVHNLSNMGKRSPDQSVHSATATHSAHHSGSNFDPAFSETRVTSPELWVDAAVRTSKITELPVLVRLATESHLVAFLAINLFHAAIVLAVLALSQPLSDTAQDVKRTITRIFRVQDLIGKRSALSKQSTLILKNVVALLLRRESEAMLAPFTGTTESTSHQALRNGPDSFPFSVEDALRLPADATLNSRQSLAMNDELYDVNPLHRLNESLASVQHALGPGDDRFFGTPPSGNILPGHESIEQSGHSNGVWQPPAQGWDVPESIQSASLGNSYDGNMEGGIYWLWDMTWNAADR